MSFLGGVGENMGPYSNDPPLEDSDDYNTLNITFS